MKLFNYLLVLIGSLFFTLAKADEILARQLKFETITINDGLSQGMVNAMLQDRYGFMWFATKDGLNRYDGYHFTVYKHDPSNNKSIADNFIQTIFEDSKGRLWIGTASKGLDLFERETETFQHFQHDDSKSNSISNDQVNHILEDHLGNIFLNTQNGINKLTITEKNGKATFSFQLKNWCRGNLFASNSKFLFISNRAMLFKISENKNGIDYIDSIDLNKVKTGIPAGEKITTGFNSFLEDTIQHRYYFFSEQYIFSLNEADNHFEMIYKNNHNGGIFHPHFDESKTIWCCNYDWVSQFDLQKKTMTRILADDKNLERMLNSINCVYIDHSGIVWIGTKGFGVLKYNPRSEKFHATISPSTGFMSATVDNKIVFTNLNQNLFNQFNRATSEYKTVVPYSTSLPSATLNNYRTVDDAVQDDDGNFWVGKGGLICYNASKNKIEEYKTGNQYNFPIYKNRKNEIWFGCENAFCYFDKARKQTIKYPFPFPVSNSPYKFLEVIYQAADDIFWLGTSAGILRFNVKKKEWKQFKNNPEDSASLSFDLVFSICPDPKHPSRYLWIGTNGGLNKFDTETGKVIRFSEKNGLANNVIYGILSDADGNLWMSTNKGLSRFNPEKKIFRNFEMKDGLQGNEFNRYAYCKTKDGILFFGGMNGFNYFNPKELIDNPFRPKVQITDFKISNRSVAICENSPLTKPIYLTNEIELNYADNMISFDFAAFDFTASPNNLYQYKLEGFDKEWIQSGTNHTATYTNLNPGVYTFKVKGSNSDGVWNEEGTAIKIIIHPPWYMTWWFRVSLVLLAFGIVYSIYKYRLNETIKLQQIRNRIAGDLHDEIGSTLSSISLFSEVVKKKTRATMPEVTPMLTRISENIDNMMEAMNDIVWTINSSNDSFENIITRIRATAAELFEAKGYELHLDFDEKLNQVNLGMQERKNIYLLFKEASNNIAKYADGKNVFLSIHLDKKNIEMKIADDGKGFDIATAVNGNGMNTMKKRAEELKGKLKIKSAINEGTMIEIIFPIT